MPHVEKHAPGTFAWLELATTDQNAAKQFYGALLGWQIQDHPMGPDAVYTMFQLEGRDCGACHTLRPEARAQGVPPNWVLYIAVENADDIAARAGKMGGTVLHPPFEVMNYGRMAVIRDPTGAVISIWQPNAHIGTGITGVNGTLCWADLNTTDRKAAKAFYEQLFGWEIVPGKDKSPDDYLHIKNGEEFIGGIPPLRDQADLHPHWLPYFLVADCDASTAQAKQLGAQVYLEPTSPDPALRLSVLADPQGAAFALFASKH